uniref:FLZ-type domain-containing protein n=1 Tax=Oryza rufipogon TaxID=4529 RepID=A0A0E0PTN3_ORYRU
MVLPDSVPENLKAIDIVVNHENGKNCSIRSTIFLVDDNSSSSCAGGGDDDYHYLDACFLCKRDITSTATSSCTSTYHDLN